MDAAYRYNDAEEYGLYNGVTSNGSMINYHTSAVFAGWTQPNLGFGFPEYGDKINWWYHSPNWWCDNASNQDRSGNYSSSQPSYEFVAGQGYRIKTTLPLGAGNWGPDGVCEDEEVTVTANAWSNWGTGVGFKT